jgi:glycosyltransferase involved in cell wall biosynthesis
MSALVSVITPAYNAQAFIGETIASVINQSYPHWEMVIIDDGSTDGTGDVIQTYLGDTRIKYVYQKNQERAVARNNGIRLAAGKYIAFLDADDMWLPDKLKIQVEYLETHPEIGLCFTHYLLMDKSGSPLGMPATHFKQGRDQFCNLLEVNFIPNSTVIVPRAVFEQVGWFDETLPAFGSEDWDMWLRIVRFHPIHFIDQPLMLYRLHSSNTALNTSYISAQAVLKKIFSDPTLPAHIVKNKNKIYALIDYVYSEAYAKLRQRKMALAYWQSAWQKDPIVFFTTKRGIWATLKLLIS